MTAKLLWFAAAVTRCRDCGRPTRARHFAICAACLRARWLAGETWPFPYRPDTQQKEREHP
jgi:hypothetical protein